MPKKMRELTGRIATEVARMQQAVIDILELDGQGTKAGKRKPSAGLRVLVTTILSHADDDRWRLCAPLQMMMR